MYLFTPNFNLPKVMIKCFGLISICYYVKFGNSAVEFLMDYGTGNWDDVFGDSSHIVADGPFKRKRWSSSQDPSLHQMVWYTPDLSGTQASNSQREKVHSISIHLNAGTHSNFPYGDPFNKHYSLSWASPMIAFHDKNAEFDLVDKSAGTKSLRTGRRVLLKVPPPSIPGCQESCD